MLALGTLAAVVTNDIGLSELIGLEPSIKQYFRVGCFVQVVNKCGPKVFISEIEMYHSLRIDTRTTVFEICP